MAAASEYRTESDMHLERLFREHHERVLRAAYRITGSMADAEDVAQAVFLRAYAADASHVENAVGYLYRAAVNGALDVLRKRAREGAVELGHEMPEGAHPGPEKQYELQELRAWLRNALGGLDPKAAEMFVLRYVEGCDLGEIARSFSTSRAVVAVILHRTRTRLRKDFCLKMRGKR